MACSKAANLVSINSGISLLLSAPDTYVLRPENMEKPPFDGSTGGHSSGSPWALNEERHTYGYAY